MLLTSETKSYASVAEAALGIPGKVIGIAVVQLSLIGINATLLVLFGNTLNRIAPINAVATGMTLNGSRMIWVTIGCVLAQPFIWIKRISDIGIFSAAGVIAVFFLAALTVYAGSAQYAKNVAEGAEIVYLKQKWSPVGVGMTLCYLVFSFGSVPIIPSVHNEMKNPQNFSKVLCTAYGVIFVINAVVSVAGYMGFAKVMAETDVDSVMDLLVPPGEPVDSVGALATAAAIVIVLTHIFVLFRPVADACQSLGEHCLGHSEVIRKLSRTLPSLIILAIGLGVSSLGIMVLLVASVTVMIMCLQLPPILYARLLVARGGDLRKQAVTWVLSGLIILMGFYAMGVGLYYGVDVLAKSS